jgi:hypothetical protein
MHFYVIVNFANKNHKLPFLKAAISQLTLKISCHKDTSRYRYSHVLFLCSSFCKTHNILVKSPLYLKNVFTSQNLFNFDVLI